MHHKHKTQTKTKTQQHTPPSTKLKKEIKQTEENGNMKTINEIKKQLETLKPLLKKKYQVATIGIFGSYTRGEQNPKSDIDILIEFSENAHIGFFKFLELEEFLTKKLQVKVDLVTKNALKPAIKEQILKETIYA